MEKGKGNKSSPEHPEIKAAKINLIGVILAALVGFAGVALTVYVGYLEDQQSQTAKPETIATTVPPQDIAPSAVGTPAILTNVPVSNSSNFQLDPENIWRGVRNAVIILLAIMVVVILKRSIRYAFVDFGSARSEVFGDSQEEPILAQLIFLRPKERVGEIIDIHSTITLGRDRFHVDIQLMKEDDNSSISSLHCTILVAGDLLMIRDEGSTNGTWLNGEILKQGEGAPLKNGDIIQLGLVDRGGVELRFRSILPGQNNSQLYYPGRSA